MGKKPTKAAGPSRRWPPAPKALIEAFDAVLPSAAGVERRKMFGYPAVFVNGNMFAGLVRDKLVLRLGSEDRQRFMQLAGASPFVAMGGREMKQWAVVPPHVVGTPELLQLWLERALAHGRTLPPKRPRAARPPQTPAARPASRRPSHRPRGTP